MREAFAASGNSMSEEIKSATVSDKIYKVAMKICKNRTRDLDDLIDDPNGFEALVSDKDWAVLSQDEHNDKSLADQKHTEWMKKGEQEQQPKPKKKPKAKKIETMAAAAAVEEDDDYDEEYDDEYGEYDDEDAGGDVAADNGESAEPAFAENKLTAK